MKGKTSINADSQSQSKYQGGKMKQLLFYVDFL